MAQVIEDWEGGSTAPVIFAGPLALGKKVGIAD
jgi:hypothetical protein